MRPEDLIPAFMDVIREYAPASALAIGALDDFPVELEDGDYPDALAALGFVDFLCNELDALSAPYTYFGVEDQDGACFGFWPAIDSLEEDARCGDEVIKVNAGDQWPSPLPDSVNYIMEVNDHGNVSLYDAHTLEWIWDCV